MLESVDLHGLDVVHVQIPLKQSKITLNWLRGYILLVRCLCSEFIEIGKVIKEVYRYIAQAHTFTQTTCASKKSSLKFKSCALKFESQRVRSSKKIGMNST